MHDRETFGCNIRVIDTPGFGDSQMRDQEFSIIIKDALFNTVQSIDGLHVILLVFKISAT
jgi:predicted GTPase